MKIAAISYLNTIPFVYGIRRANHDLHADLLLDIPSSCHSLLNDKHTDIALIPVADLPKVRDCRIVTPYCIGAETDVRTVALFSDVAPEALETVYLDSHSATSVRLIRILAREKWRIAPRWERLTDYSLLNGPAGRNGYLLIGDKVFDYETRFARKLDLATEWFAWTGLPFVFAVWVARKEVTEQTVASFTQALTYGLDHRADAIRQSRYVSDYERSLAYVTHNIRYDLDEPKKNAIRLFLRHLELPAGGASPD